MFRQLSSQIGVVLSRDRLVVTLSIRLLIDFDILLDRRFIYIDTYQVFLLVWLGRLRNVSRSVAWSGITIDWERPSFVNQIVVDKKNQDHRHRIKIIITTMSQRVVGE
jgi:hypothetical protein